MKPHMSGSQSNCRHGRVASFSFLKNDSYLQALPRLPAHLVGQRDRLEWPLLVASQVEELGATALLASRANREDNPLCGDDVGRTTGGGRGGEGGGVGLGDSAREGTGPE